MASKQLWAPWRIAYIKGETASDVGPTTVPRWLDGADRDCFLCRAVAEHGPAAQQVDRQNLLVRCGEVSFVVLNRFPYNNGHLLIAPRLHKARLDQLTAEEHVEIQQQITDFSNQIEREMNAEGFNVGLNLGRVAGAGVPGHLHWHLVPRWSGDVNFMPITAGVNVMPQSLDALWQLLTEEEPVL